MSERPKSKGPTKEELMWMRLADPRFWAAEYRRRGGPETPHKMYEPTLRFSADSWQVVAGSVIGGKYNNAEDLIQDILSGDFRYPTQTQVGVGPQEPVPARCITRDICADCKSHIGVNFDVFIAIDSTKSYKDILQIVKHALCVEKNQGLTLGQ